MSRPLRIEFEDALYHVTTRGNRAEPIFVDDEDRTALLATIGQGMERFQATGFAYCLMGNHYHLVLQTHRANLSCMMRHINGIYAQAYNRRHAKVGHLFQGRFHAILVQHDAYFLEVCRYVDLNPVRACMVPRPQDWPWSSYRAHAGRAKGQPWLDSETLYGCLTGGATRPEKADAYARFVSDGLAVKLWEKQLLAQIYLGDAPFVAMMQKKSAVRPEDREIPRAQRCMPGSPIQHYLRHADREVAVARAHLAGGYTQAAIARALGLSPTRISRLIARYCARGKT